MRRSPIWLILGLLALAAMCGCASIKVSKPQPLDLNRLEVYRSGICDTDAGKFPCKAFVDRSTQRFYIGLYSPFMLELLYVIESGTGRVVWKKEVPKEKKPTRGHSISGLRFGADPLSARYPHIQRVVHRISSMVYFRRWCGIHQHPTISIS